MIETCVISTLYALTLNRSPEPAAVGYWQQATVQDLGDAILFGPELDGEVNWEANYELALGYQDPEGAAWWRSQPDQLDALRDFAWITGFGCPIPEAVTHPEGWIDLGNGVYGPVFMERIGWCESKDDYNAKNPRSSASGRWQAINKTWRWITGRTDTARDATPVEQDRFAIDLLEAANGNPYSTMAWYESSRCWG